MSSKKDLNFEINILPILDILSVLICFLLLTAVWVQVGTLDTRQAIGDNTSSAGKNPPAPHARRQAQILPRRDRGKFPARRRP